MLSRQSTCAAATPNFEKLNASGALCAQPVFGSRFPVPGSRLPVPGSRFPVPGSRFPPSPSPSPSPSDRAEERRATGRRVCQVAHLLRELTRRSCSSEALQARNEFCGAACCWSTAGCPQRSEGTRAVGGASFAYFACTSKKSRSPAGARPGICNYRSGNLIFRLNGMERCHYFCRANHIQYENGF